MFHTYFYEPLYNLLVIALNIAPLHDIGIAIVLVTLFVRGVLLPLNLSASRSQYAIKKVDKEMKEIRESNKKDPQLASKKIMELYRREKINPFASLFVIIIQIPVLLALFFVFRDGFTLDTESLYSFLSFPETLHTNAFGLIDVTKKSIIVALLTAISAYVLAKRQTSTMVSVKESKDETFQDHFMKSMRIQLVYVLPVVIGVSALVFPAALGIYWVTGNLVGIAQDYYIKKKYHYE